MELLNHTQLKHSHGPDVYTIAKMLTLYDANP